MKHYQEVTFKKAQILGVASFISSEYALNPIEALVRALVYTDTIGAVHAKDCVGEVLIEWEPDIEEIGQFMKFIAMELHERLVDDSKDPIIITKLIDSHPVSLVASEYRRMLREYLAPVDTSHALEFIIKECLKLSDFSLLLKHREVFTEKTISIFLAQDKCLLAKCNSREFDLLNTLNYKG